MYREFFGIEENPFSNTPDPKYIYMSQRHSEALAHLVFGVQGGSGFVLLTGEVGTGKTTLCRYLADQMDDEIKLALCLNPRVSEVDLLATICEELGVEINASPNSIKDLTSSLNTFLLDLYAAGGRASVIIDEAQSLSFELLEQVRLLTNLETTHNKLLQIILIGQPELKDHLDEFRLRQLSQRISARYHLEPMTAEETRKYIAHRAGIAGLADDVYSPGALNEIYRYSHGVPRLINSICERCLLGAYATGQKIVSRDLAGNAAQEVLGSSMAKATSKNTVKKTPVFIIMLAVLLAIIATGYIVFDFLRPNHSANENEPITMTRKKPSSLVDQGSLSQSLDDSDTYEAAFSRLVGLWTGAREVRSEIHSCQDTTTIGLACLSWEGSWDEINRLNRPFIVSLRTSQDDFRYVVVRALQNGLVTLETTTQQIQISSGNILTLAPDNILFLWQPPPFYNRTLQPGMSGKDVAWVRRRLIRISTELPGDIDDPQHYGDELLKEVNSFKQAHKLKADGIIDPVTLILIDDAIGDVIAPVLHEKS